MRIAHLYQNIVNKKMEYFFEKYMFHFILKRNMFEITDALAAINLKTIMDILICNMLMVTESCTVA